MILTRTHALYWAQHKAPEALRRYAPKVTIDDCVNAHAPRIKVVSVTEPHNTMAILHLKRKHGEAGAVAWILSKLSDDGPIRVDDRRIAYCRKWAAKILKARKQRESQNRQTLRPST